MRISWLSAEEIAAARQALTANGATWDSHFGPEFRCPEVPEGAGIADWKHLAEHVARAERVVEVLRGEGLEAAREKFAGTGVAIEAATLASAALEDEALGLDEVIGVLECPIDSFVFYAPFLELLFDQGREQVERTVAAYERFAVAYAAALAREPHGLERIGAVRDGLADFYVRVGRIEDAQALFERRHDEDTGDVAVALSASRAFLAAGLVSHAVKWLGVGAQRAAALGREDFAERLRQKQERVRERLS